MTELQPIDKAKPEIFEFPIGGVTVKFPFKIIKSLSKKENALLESPTGTGKTLSILCSVLAWQEHERSLIMNQPSIKIEEPSKEKKSNPKTAPVKDCISSDDDSFQKLESKFFSGSLAKPKEVKKEPEIEVQNRKLPKIYVASRTQKQINQMVNELRRKTQYRPKMAILGSREHYCIHRKARKESNRNDACESLLKNNSCVYYNKALDLQRTVRNREDLKVWDIEDLVTAGKEKKGCPYYASRGLAATADIVFLPYNYLVDPFIRKASEIDLKDAIVVIDEAHNIESTAADSGSFEVSSKTLSDIENHLKGLTRANAKKTNDEDVAEIYSQKFIEHYKVLLHLMTKITEWLSAYASKNLMPPKSDFNFDTKTIHGHEALVHLSSNCEINGQNIHVYENALEAITPKPGEKEEQEEGLTRPELNIFQGLFAIIKFLLSPQTVQDFKMAISRKKFNDKSEHQVLCFWCLNPGLIFAPLNDLARSIVLTSGTLSPLASFGSELSINFENRLEANHCIEREQLWVTGISQGLTGRSLYGSFKNYSTWNYQDELGLSLVEICKKVPGGVLVFLPSYSLLDTLIKRWSSIGAYNEINSIKDIYYEPRTNKGGEFDQLLEDYAKSLEGKGGIIFCIYRGKMSEGIDFADNRARAVVCVGIPYPNMKDQRVLSKMEYNNSFFKQKSLLKGNDWFEIQAFRALNQAFGRCIRHRHDWGAIILLDERFCNSERYFSNLPKWIRHQIQRNSSFSNAMASLEDFCKRRVDIDRSRTTSLEIYEIKKEEESLDLTCGVKLAKKRRIYPDKDNQDTLSLNSSSLSSSSQKTPAKKVQTSLYDVFQKAAKASTSSTPCSVISSSASTPSEPSFSPVLSMTEIKPLHLLKENIISCHACNTVLIDIKMPEKVEFCSNLYWPRKLFPSFSCVKMAGSIPSTVEINSVDTLNSYSCKVDNIVYIELVCIACRGKAGFSRD